MTTQTKIGVGVLVVALTVGAKIASADQAPDKRSGQCVAIAEASSPSLSGHVYGWAHGGCPPQMLAHYRLRLKKRVGDEWVTVATSDDGPTPIIACSPFEQYKTKVVQWAAEPGGGSAEIDTDTSRIMFCGAA
jgi:hypothetical protein